MNLSSTSGLFPVNMLDASISNANIVVATTRHNRTSNDNVSPNVDENENNDNPITPYTTFSRNNNYNASSEFSMSPPGFRTHQTAETTTTTTIISPSTSSTNSSKQSPSRGKVHHEGFLSWPNMKETKRLDGSPSQIRSQTATTTTAITIKSPKTLMQHRNSAVSIRSSPRRQKFNSFSGNTSIKSVSPSTMSPQKIRPNTISPSPKDLHLSRSEISVSETSDSIDPSLNDNRYETLQGNEWRHDQQGSHSNRTGLPTIRLDDSTVTMLSNISKNSSNNNTVDDWMLSASTFGVGGHGAASSMCSSDLLGLGTFDSSFELSYSSDIVQQQKQHSNFDGVNITESPVTITTTSSTKQRALTAYEREMERRREKNLFSTQQHQQPHNDLLTLDLQTKSDSSSIEIKNSKKKISPNVLKSIIEFQRGKENDDMNENMPLNIGSLTLRSPSKKKQIEETAVSTSKLETPSSPVSLKNMNIASVNLVDVLLQQSQNKDVIQVDASTNEQKVDESKDSKTMNSIELERIRREQAQERLVLEQKVEEESQSLDEDNVSPSTIAKEKERDTSSTIAIKESATRPPSKINEVGDPNLDRNIKILHQPYPTNRIQRTENSPESDHLDQSSSSSRSDQFLLQRQIEETKRNGGETSSSSKYIAFTAKKASESDKKTINLMKVLLKDRQDSNDDNSSPATSDKLSGNAARRKSLNLLQLLLEKRTSESDSSERINKSPNKATSDDARPSRTSNGSLVDTTIENDVIPEEEYLDKHLIEFFKHSAIEQEHARRIRLEAKAKLFNRIQQLEENIKSQMKQEENNGGPAENQYNHPTNGTTDSTQNNLPLIEVQSQNVSSTKNAAIDSSDKLDDDRHAVPASPVADTDIKLAKATTTDPFEEFCDSHNEQQGSRVNRTPVSPRKAFYMERTASTDNLVLDIDDNEVARFEVSPVKPWNSDAKKATRNKYERHLSDDVSESKRFSTLMRSHALTLENESVRSLKDGHAQLSTVGTKITDISNSSESNSSTDLFGNSVMILRSTHIVDGLDGLYDNGSSNNDNTYNDDEDDIFGEDGPDEVMLQPLQPMALGNFLSRKSTRRSSVSGHEDSSCSTSVYTTRDEDPLAASFRDIGFASSTNGMDIVTLSKIEERPTIENNTNDSKERDDCTVDSSDRHSTTLLDHVNTNEFSHQFAVASSHPNQSSLKSFSTPPDVMIPQTTEHIMVGNNVAHDSSTELSRSALELEGGNEQVATTAPVQVSNQILGIENAANESHLQTSRYDWTKYDKQASNNRSGVFSWIPTRKKNLEKTKSHYAGSIASPKRERKGSF